MGARGNSGVITSQIFRGMAEALGGKKRFNGLDLAHALSEGTKTAYSAVAKPVEGTILTVIRESAAAAVAAAEHDNDIEVVLAATLDGAEKSVARTPEPARDPARGRRRGFGRAGPVPALPGSAAPPRREGAGLRRTRPGPDRRRSRPRSSPTPMRASATRRCSCSRRPARACSTSTPSATTSNRSASPSWSPATARALKVHVHNERPDLVIGFGLTQGSMSRISVENLDNQARDVRESKAAAFTTDAVDGATAGSGADEPVAAVPSSDRTSRSSRSSRATDSRPSSEEFGVAAVVQGGQSSNPSTGELLEAIRRVDAREILLLPNNPNVDPRGPPGRPDDRHAGHRRSDPERGRRFRRPARPRPGSPRRGQRRAR